jgi:hypothetical protein
MTKAVVRLKVAMVLRSERTRALEIAAEESTATTKAETKVKTPLIPLEATLSASEAAPTQTRRIGAEGRTKRWRYRLARTSVADRFVGLSDVVDNN